MGEKEWTAGTIFDLFGDELARRILILVNQRPMAADDLTGYLDASSPTIYRRLNSLSDYDLIKEDIRVTGDGNHHKTYEATLKQITFELESGGYNIDISLRQDIIDQFEAFWDDLDRSSPEVNIRTPIQPDQDPTRTEGLGG